MGRAAVLTWLRSPQNTKGPAPLRLGSPIVLAGVVREEGIWRIREAEFDQTGFTTFARAEEAAGRPLYPEYADAYRLPTGRVLLEAPSLEAFIRAVEAYDWPRNW